MGGSVSLGLAKLDEVTGSRDPSYPVNVQAPGEVYVVAQQPDGKILVGGDFWFAGGLPRANLARVNKDGSFDAKWNPNPGGSVHAIAINGTNIYVGGEFTSIGGQNVTHLAKLSTMGTDAADPDWKPYAQGDINSLAASGTDVYAAGCCGVGMPGLNLAKLSGIGTGAVDRDWNPAPDRSISAMALSGTDLFVGGHFSVIGGQVRTNLAKLSTTGTGAADTNWIPNASDAFVSTLAVNDTNLFVGGTFTSIGSQSRTNLAKLSTMGSGAVDPVWNSGLFASRVTALGASASNLYAAGHTIIESQTGSLIARLDTGGTGRTIATWLVDPYSFGVRALIADGTDVHAGGNFRTIGGVPRHGFAFLPMADAPQLIQDNSTNLFILRNAADGPEVTHFLVTGLGGGSLYHSDGVTTVNVGGFLTVAEGSAGLRFVPGGTVSAVSSLNNTPDGAGTAESSLMMSTNPSPVLKFDSAAYSVREGQGSVVVTLRKFGDGAATVACFTSNLTATGGLDYQTRSNTLGFSATDKVKNLIITIADDLLIEGDEQFAMTLTNASTNAVIAGPATSIVAIIDNDIIGLADSLTTTVAPTNPPAANGALSVSLQPTNANGQWRLLGELNWHDSGALVSGLVTGNYGVEFHPANGYREPQNVTIPITAGTTNSVTFLYAATTNLATGNLSITIQPSDVATAGAVTNRGQWRWQSEGAWLDSGEVVPNLNAGNYTAVFKSVPGRIAPAPRIIEVGGGNATYGTIATYLFAPPPSGEPPAVVPFGTATTNEPYLFNGQIQTSVGFGSGFVVKEKVVLTAAHVLFDDVQLSYVTGVRWFFQRYRGQLEPVPQEPRGWYVYEGYSAQRELDNSPGISTPASQNLDMAALFFLEAAGRGGYGGYLSSDADNNEYLLSANNKFLVGYPLDGVAEGDQGKLHATTPANITFTRLYTSVFATTNIQAFPGNSGGPLYVQADVNKYLPAAIVLGGSRQTLVRAINSEVVDLINRAEISGNGGGNVVGGGPIIPVNPGQTAPPFGTGLLTVSMTPSNMIGFRPGWRVTGDTDTNYFTDALTTVALVGGGGYPIEFKAVPGFVTPSNRIVQVAVNQVATLQAEYVPIRPLLDFSFSNGLSLQGGTGASYRVEYATNVTTPITWTPLTTQVLVNASLTISNTLPAGIGSCFYRAVLAQ